MTWDYTREEADDIISDCMTSLIKKIRQKGSLNDPDSYIWMTLRRRLARLARIRNAEQKALDNYDPGDLIYDPYLETDIMEKKEIMYNAMKSLNDTCYKIMDYYLKNYDLDAIKYRLSQKDTKSVSDKLRYCLQKLVELAAEERKKRYYGG